MAHLFLCEKCASNFCFVASNWSNSPSQFLPESLKVWVKGKKRGKMKKRSLSHLTGDSSPKMKSISRDFFPPSQFPILPGIISPVLGNTDRDCEKKIIFFMPRAQGVWEALCIFSPGIYTLKTAEGTVRDVEQSHLQLEALGRHSWFTTSFFFHLKAIV